MGSALSDPRLLTALLVLAVTHMLWGSQPLDSWGAELPRRHEPTRVARSPQVSYASRTTSRRRQAMAKGQNQRKETKKPKKDKK